MLDQLEETSKVMSLEAHCGSASLESAVAQVPSFVDKLKTFFSDWASSIKFPGSGVVFKKPVDFLRAIGKTTYTDFKQVNLFVPQGLRVSYVTYADKLLTAMAFILKTEEDFIDPYIKWLGVKLGQPTALASNISGFGDSDILKKDKLTEIERAVQECFTLNGQRNSEVPYMSAIGRQGDWALASDKLITLTSTLNDDYHKRLMSKMDRIEDLLTVISKRMVESPEVYKLSPTTVAEMVTGAYASAKYFEFYGITRYRVDEFRKSVEDSISKLVVFVK